MKYENLSPELQEKAKAHKTTEDVLELAKDEGYELSDAEIESISGGWDCPIRCADLCEKLLIPVKRRHTPPIEQHAPHHSVPSSRPPRSSCSLR